MSRSGLIQAIPRDRSSGHRRYSADTIHIVETLAHLRASGLSIKDMRMYIRLREYGDAAAVEQKALFAAHAQRVAEEIHQLTIRQRFLNTKVAYWEARRQGNVALAEQIAAENRAIAKELK